MDHFFTIDNLTALREIALPQNCRQGEPGDGEEPGTEPDSEYYTGSISWCVCPSSPSNAKVIRAAARMSNAFRARFTAVHVEMPGGEGMAEEDALVVCMNQRLAEQLGARAVTLYGGDITRQIAEYARISGVSKIVLGRSYTKRRLFSECEFCGSALLRWCPGWRSI